MSRLPEEIVEAMQRTARLKQRPCIVQLNGNELRCVITQARATFFLLEGVRLDDTRVIFTLAGFNAAHPIAAKAILNALKVEL